MAKVSIIIPIYKVEQYIERCARSLFEQKLQDIEYIFVNDCTPDRSVEILTEVLKEYPDRAPFVKIINHSFNQGLTRTRNTGLLYASGEYIAHCDSDDWVDENMYLSLYNEAVRSCSDLVYSDFYFAYKDKIEFCQTAEYDSDRVQMIRNYISSVWTSLVNLIAKRDLYVDNNLKSPEHISYCEDFWLSVRLFYYSEKITKVSEPLYYYNQCNVTSIMHNLNKYVGDDMKCYLETIGLFSQLGTFAEYEEVLCWRVLNALHFDMYYPERHKGIVEIFPLSHKYILSCPFYTMKQKILMWMLTHKCRIGVLFLLKIRELLGRTSL